MKAVEKKRLMLLGAVMAVGVWFWAQPAALGVKQFLKSALTELRPETEYRLFANYDLGAEAAIVIDQDTGKVLFFKNDQERKAPASTTKMMTALLGLERKQGNETVEVGREVLLKEPGESTAGLQPGQQITWYQLIEALMLPSGNDAARTIAVQIGREASGDPEMSVDEAMEVFVGLMNERAGELGLRNTHFSNPHGLNDPDHYSSAYDLALIAQEAMKNKQFAAIVRTTYAEVTPALAGAQGEVSGLVNRNQLLQKGSEYYYEGATGIKTGFTDEAGYCLVSSAVRDGRHLIAVVLHSTSDKVWKDSHKLLDFGFGQLN
ncbi:MAG: D-alanyl-D-alanine carboxypeptidase family protein [Paenibacillus dendritiformis]|uniref:D-alanyl-D-alanine carboxypeptidase family protein n=1 Tax=uncultured Paenibacillus sp. TaxID=227322 RepID=UPI0025F37CB1|nr:D-alanyl-D-alanine carboxypeptidase family protein [uncultured Paenibacillus sp.]MDU5140833.1 D-alanyl-D-alanine carboxypeptidase family protein [Paenibacillus dendritiformis]